MMRTVMKEIDISQMNIIMKNLIRNISNFIDLLRDIISFGIDFPEF